MAGPDPSEAGGSLPEDVVLKIRADFSAESFQAVMSVLLAYHGPEPARIARCILHLSGGDMQKLRDNAAAAALDFRDVIWWAEYDGTDRRIRDFTRPVAVASATQPVAWNRIVREIMSMLAERDYRALELLTRGVRLSAEQIETAIRQYGRTVAPYPESAAPQLDAIEVAHASAPTWSVRAPVFTVEEGWSDLTLELTLLDRPQGECEVEIDGIHVL
jgi:hypothetical protein